MFNRSANAFKRQVKWDSSTVSRCALAGSALLSAAVAASTTTTTNLQQYGEEAKNQVTPWNVNRPFAYRSSPCAPSKEDGSLLQSRSRQRMRELEQKYSLLPQKATTRVVSSGSARQRLQELRSTHAKRKTQAPESPDMPRSIALWDEQQLVVPRDHNLSSKHRMESPVLESPEMPRWIASDDPDLISLQQQHQPQVKKKKKKKELEYYEVEIQRPQNESSLKKTGRCDTLDNHIVLISNVLTPSECKLLRNNADRLLDSGEYKRDLIEDDEDEEDDTDKSLRGVSLCDMSDSAQSISHKIIFQRVLPALRRHNPPLLFHLGLSNFDKPHIALDWAADEPTINRYQVGGKFDPHRDGYALTVIILLSEDGAFEGGGTRFFTDNRRLEDEKDNSVLVKPTQGTAALFSGDVIHTGCPVTKGTRHVYVASFSLRC